MIVQVALGAAALLGSYALYKKAPKKGVVPYPTPSPADGGFAQTGDAPLTAGPAATGSTLLARGIVSRAGAVYTGPIQGHIVYTPTAGDSVDAVAKRFNITAHDIEQTLSPISGPQWLIKMGATDYGPIPQAMGTAKLEHGTL